MPWIRAVFTPRLVCYFLGVSPLCLGLECTALLPLASAARCEGGNAARHLCVTPPSRPAPLHPQGKLLLLFYLFIYLPGGGAVNPSFWGHGCVVSLELDMMPPGLGGRVGGFGAWLLAMRRMGGVR